MGEQLLEETLRRFVVENFLYGDQRAPLDRDDSFSDKGIIDSTGVLELVTFVESKFGIVVADEEVIPENFDSISRLIRYIERKQNGEVHVA